MFSVILRNFSSFGERYGITLLNVAQATNQIKEVSGDVKYLSELYSTSHDFRVLMSDPTVHKGKLIEILNELGTKALFCDTTNKVLKMMADNKRLNYLAEVMKNFEAKVKALEKKETVKVISADSLTDEEKKEVIKALQEMDKTKKYELNFAVDPSILGGLQLYFPTAFMELSLKSRYDKIKEEVSTIGL